MAANHSRGSQISLDEVSFLPKGDQKEQLSSKSYDSLLTKEDLLRLDREDPFWSRLRLALFILFWVVWIGLLVASVLIIVLSPSCPFRPKQDFWDRKVGYWVDPFAFRDSDGDAVGDFKGLIDSINYIKSSLGAGYVILTSLLKGHFTNSTLLGLSSSLEQIDPVLGGQDNLKSLITAFRKEGMEVVVSLSLAAISSTSYLSYNRSFFRSINEFPNEEIVNRNGLKMDSFYGSFQQMYDFNHNDPDVVQYLKNVTKLWLDMGFDGIVLSDAAFFAAGNGSFNIAFDPNTNNTWFKNYPDSQIYTDNGLKFVQEMRRFIDKYSSTSSKPRLLAVDPGDVGYGHGYGKMFTKLLGTEESPGGHIVISRQFVPNRGWKTVPQDNLMRVSVQSYFNEVNETLGGRLGLATGTPSDPRYGDSLSLASALLLPGCPIIYFGTELGLRIEQSTVSPSGVYPKGLLPLVNNDKLDTQLTANLPMPWDMEGLEFSTTNSSEIHSSFINYLNQYQINETVKYALAVGRPPQLFDLVTRLIALRNHESLHWGNLIWLKRVNNHTTNELVEIFVRHAQGFPAIAVALMRNPSHGGVLITLQEYCEVAIPKIIYPSNPHIKEDQAISTKSLFLADSPSHESVYVLLCSDVKQ